MSDLTITDAAEITGVDGSTLRRHCRNGLLTATELGPMWQITSANLKKYQAKHCFQPDEITIVEAAELTGLPERLIRDACFSKECPAKRRIWGWALTEKGVKAFAASLGNNS